MLFTYAIVDASVGPIAFCALACALCCVPPDGSNASTMVSQKATRSKKNMTTPYPVRFHPALPEGTGGRLF